MLFPSETRHPGGAPEKPEGFCREAEPPQQKTGLDQRHHLLQGDPAPHCQRLVLGSGILVVSSQLTVVSHSRHPCVSLQEKMLDVYWLLCVCIRTIEHADNTGSLFAFAPEFYLNVAMNAYSALKNYFSPANSMEELPGKPQVTCL